MANNPLHDACYHQDIPKVKALLADIKPAMLNKKLTDYNNPVQGTPLQIACTNGNLTIVQLLIAAGADIELKNVARMSPLSIAIENRHPQLVAYLIEKGADIHSKGPNNLQPIHYACLHGNKAIIELLLSKGIDMNLRDSQKDNLLSFTTDLNGGSLEATKTLVENGIDPTYYTSAFRWACWRNNPEIAAYLLDCGADYKEVTGPKSELLFWICGLGHTPIVKLLLNLGVDFTTKVKFKGKMMSYDGSPLERAITTQQQAVVDFNKGV